VGANFRKKKTRKKFLRPSGKARRAIFNFLQLQVTVTPPALQADVV